MVLTPEGDTVTVVLEFALVLVVVEEVIEPLPSLPLLDELLLANAHIGCTARAAANTKAAAHFFFISFTSPFSPKSFIFNKQHVSTPVIAPY